VIIVCASQAISASHNQRFTSVWLRDELKALLLKPLIRYLILLTIATDWF